MTQLPSGLSTRPESFAPSGESNLRLQRAVESLNLNLDDELHRYRQNRSGNATVPATPARLQLRQNRKPLDLIALKTAAPATAAAAAPPPPPPARMQEILGQSSVPTSQAHSSKATVNQVRLSHGGTLTTYRQAPEDYLESTEALLGSVPPRSRPRQADEAYPPSLARQLTTPLGVGSLLLLLVGSAGFGYLAMSPQAVQHLTDSPLARRLRGQPTEAAADDAVALDGVGGQSSAGFRPLGPDLSEKEFMSLDLSNISNLPSASAPSASQSTQQAQVEAGQPLGEQVPPEGRPGVPTAAGSGVNSGVLRAEIVAAPGAASNSSNAVPAPRPAAPATSAPAPAAPTAAPPAVQTTPPAAVQPPQPLAYRAPAPPAPLAPTGLVAPPAPITQAPPQAAPSYYVVTDYSGAQSLESARSVVGDAYVRNFSSGTRIQMGAFSQESSARSLVNQLQGQGIPAQVISP